ncbi:unnamed protein product [Rhodiola kirilowii]
MAATQDWTEEENEVFGILLSRYPEGYPARFESIASFLPSKSVDQVISHYQAFVANMEAIGACLNPVPRNSNNVNQAANDTNEVRQTVETAQPAPKKRRRKESKWTEVEHRKFLMGLEANRKGDWRGISREFVKTKTSVQVASHAQKYFKRQSEVGQMTKKRKSIHDLSVSDPQLQWRMQGGGGAGGAVAPPFDGKSPIFGSF